MSNTKPELIKPFYMWAGGKSKLLKHYAGIWPKEEFARYVEPFFGGGAVFSWLKHNDPTFEAVVGDVNVELVSLLRAVASDLDGLLSKVDSILQTYLAIPVEDKGARKKHYYDLRKQYWTSKGSNIPLLYVLMKLGFNGIWQTCKDSEGLFGTPAGLLNHLTLDQIYSKDDLEEWSKMLQSSSIQAVNYENLVFDPKGALIYLDPPYRDSFTSYGTGFNDDSQRTLVEWALKKAQQGATVLLANRCVDGERFFEDLLPTAEFHYFDVTYTAGRRKAVKNGFEAKPAREFLAMIRPA